ncbi:MAG: SprB repeat-containing protein, partial [Saprospiraceae bacterium]|nr:SprB repeat-containing protein [Saprospiraceae bacterium]
MSIKPLLLAFFLLCTTAAPGQTYTMTGAPIASCSGTFFDIGGSAGNYADNQNLHTTICPDGMGGTHLLLQFVSMMLAPGDTLCILNGSSVLAPQLACFSDIPPGLPFQVQASAANPGGCLTLTFVSNASGTAAGWSAGISCAAPCVIPAPVDVQVTGMNGGTMTWAWDAVPGSTGFEVSVNGGAWQPAGGPQTHSVTGLSPGDLVVIEIRPISANPGCSVESITANKTYAECTLDAGVVSLAPAICPGTATGSAVIGTSGAIGAVQFFVTGNPAPFANGNFTNFFTAGAYQIAVHDTAGCRDTVAFTIAEPPPIAIQITVTDAECFADNSGAVQALATGGTGSFIYAWRRCQGGMIMNGPLIIDLFAGCYAVTVTDANGCTAVAQDTIGEPPKFDFTASQDSVRCFGGMDGRATVFASGAIPPYTYKWGNGDTGTTADSLKAGFHSVTVTDAIGCQAVTLVQVLQPTRLILDSISNTPIACFGGSTGSAGVFARGGVPAYSFLWTNSQSTQTATGLGAGAHTVTVTDRNGCTLTGSTVLSEPTELLAQITIGQNETCAGACDGQLTLAVTGGTTPYSISWNIPNLPPNETTPQNLCPGGYSVTVSDANGCTRTAAATIVAAIPLSIQFSASGPTCAGNQNGGLSASGTGGALPYDFQWNTGAPGSDLMNLGCGAYTVTLSDAMGCTATGSETLPCPDAVQIDSIVPAPVACFGGTNGFISVVAQGGTGTLTFQWSDPNVQPGPVASNLAAGTYTVTVADTNGCSATASATVVEPPMLAVALTSKAVSCFGGNDGAVQSATSGGTPPYQYTWNIPASTPDLPNLPAGSFSLTVTDANGCIAVAMPAVVTQPTGLVQVTAIQTRQSCIGSSDGAAE